MFAEKEFPFQTLTIYRDEWLRGQRPSGLLVSAGEEGRFLKCCLGIHLEACGIEPRLSWKTPPNILNGVDAVEQAPPEYMMWLSSEGDDYFGSSKLAQDAMAVNDASIWDFSIAEIGMRYASKYPAPYGSEFEDRDREEILIQIFRKANIDLIFQDKRPR